MAERSSSDEVEAADSKLLVASSRRPQAASFVAKAKDEVYNASEIVREDAAQVEHMAQRVEKLSRSIEDDVDHVESAIHQMLVATNSKEETTSIQASKANDTTTPSAKLSIKDGNSTTKNSLTFEWPPQIISHVIFVLLTLCIVLFHVWGGDFIFSKSENELTNNNTLLTAKKSTTFSILLIYIGTIWKVLKSLRNTTSRQKDGVIKVEEKVHEIGQEVKNVAKDIEEIADIVEHKSHQIEEKASQIQSLIKPVEAS